MDVLFSKSNCFAKNVGISKWTLHTLDVYKVFLTTQVFRNIYYATGNKHLFFANIATTYFLILKIAKIKL